MTATPTMDWAEKLAEADRLAEEIAEARARMHELISREAKLRSQAERERAEAEAREPKADPTDKLLAAAGLAVGDFEPGFEAAQLAEALGIRGERAVRLLLALEQMHHVRREGRGALTRWAAVDPDEARARDAARNLGMFSEESLARRLDLTALGARHYVRQMIARGQVAPLDGGMFQWTPPGPERTVTRRPRRETPEAEVIRKEGDLPKRGEVVELTGRADGSSRKPMLDSRKKSSGRRVKRAKHKGYS